METNSNTREKLLYTMFQCIAKHGYEKTSLSMICTEVGIKKPSTYHYFKSKEDLFIAMIDEVIMPKEQIHIDYKVDAKDYKDMLYQRGYDVINSYKEYPELISVMMELYTQSKRIDKVAEKLEKQINNYRELLIEIFEYGIEIQALKKDFDISTNVELLLAVQQGIEFSIVYNQKLDYENIWETTIDRMM